MKQAEPKPMVKQQQSTHKGQPYPRFQWTFSRLSAAIIRAKSILLSQKTPPMTPRERASVIFSYVMPLSRKYLSGNVLGVL